MDVGQQLIILIMGYGFVALIYVGIWFVLKMRQCTRSDPSGGCGEDGRAMLVMIAAWTLTWANITGAMFVLESRSIQ